MGVSSLEVISRFHKQVVQIFSGEAALKHAVFRHRDGAGLLRNDNDNGIRILAHSDGGTMPGAKALVDQLFFLRFSGRKQAAARIFPSRIMTAPSWSGVLL